MNTSPYEALIIRPENESVFDERGTHNREDWRETYIYTHYTYMHIGLPASRTPILNYLSDKPDTVVQWGETRQVSEWCGSRWGRCDVVCVWEGEREREREIRELLRDWYWANVRYNGNEMHDYIHLYIDIYIKWWEVRDWSSTWRVSPYLAINVYMFAHIMGVTSPEAIVQSASSRSWPWHSIHNS